MQAIYLLWPELQEAMRDLFWIQPSWILLGSSDDAEPCPGRPLRRRSGCPTRRCLDRRRRRPSPQRWPRQRTASAVLSIVAATRNDDHGGGLARRMQICFAGILAQADRHRVPTELVIVEWNPPPDRPRLAEALRWPRANRFCTVRILEVSSEIHRRYRLAEHLPLYQMIAKNAGIRRARGPLCPGDHHRHPPVRSLDGSVGIGSPALRRAVPGGSLRCGQRHPEKAPSTSSWPTALPTRCG